MNKTIYIRAEDLPTWERAREIYGGQDGKIAGLIMELLKRYVQEKEAVVPEGAQDPGKAYEEWRKP